MGMRADHPSCGAVLRTAHGSLYDGTRPVRAVTESMDTGRCRHAA